MKIPLSPFKKGGIIRERDIINNELTANGL